jgi:transcriptional regulator with XRE-family HTH domain
MRSITQNESDAQEESQMAKKSKAWAICQTPGWLKRVREECGISQQALSKGASVSRSVIANYESGRTTLDSLEHAWLLCAALSALGSKEARDAARELLQALRKTSQREIASLEGHIVLLQRKLAEEKDWLADVESEAARWSRTEA